MIYLHEITTQEFFTTIRNIVRQEMEARYDRPLSRREVASTFGVSLGTVDKWIKRGEIQRINPGNGQARYSFNQINKLHHGR